MEDTIENRAKIKSFTYHQVNVLPSIEDREGTMVKQVWIDYVRFDRGSIAIRIYTKTSQFAQFIHFDYEEFDCTEWKFWGRTKDQVNNQPESGPTMFEKTGKTTRLQRLLTDWQEVILKYYDADNDNWSF